MGLRPLLFHVDAGWNTDHAVGNIENLVDGLGLDLYIEVAYVFGRQSVVIVLDVRKKTGLFANSDEVCTHNGKTVHKLDPSMLAKMLQDAGAGVSSLFVFKGKYRAVLINYPATAQKDEISQAANILQ